MISVAAAATTANDFNVTVTLTSQCQATNSATQTVAFGTYTAFQTTALNAPAVNLTYRCTRGYAPTSVAFDTVDPNSTTAGVGVIQGLQYSLSTVPSTTAGTAATSASIGTGDIRTYAVSGSMPADQAGACATASCGPTTQLRTLTVTF